jgi:hypothetical protein
MFQSYTYLEYLGYDPKTNKYSWRYKIVDSEFKEVAIVGAPVRAGAWLEIGLTGAVIDIYSKRGLPVAPNLFIALQWYGYSLEQLIAWQKQHNPKFKPYEQEIEKYLVFLRNSQ